MRRYLPFLAATILLASPHLASSAEIESLAATIHKVNAGGQGNQAASKAWQELAASPTSDLVAILSAIDSEQPLAANWLRSAVDAIASRSVAAGAGLPQAELREFVLGQGDPRARRLAFEWLRRVDGKAAEELIPKLLNDSSVELRREAVGQLASRAGELLKQGKREQATDLYAKALDAARDNDQVKEVVKELKSLGREVDLPTHFGFLMKWKIIGPFDNTGRKGFDTVYPPEKELAAEASYAGKDGEVSWVDYETTDDYGMVDINKPLGSLKETVAYAWTEFDSDGGQDVELRLGCKNAWKVWLNGELVFGRDEYHRGMQLDQYRMKVRMRPGRNQILVKACQNEQTESWTVEWQFQLRVCDAAGTAILSSK